MVQRAQRKGRPTIFKCENYDLVRNYCLLGANNTQLAQYLGVSLEVINKWIREDPYFVHILKAGREDADAEVATRTYTRACGFEKVEKEEVVINGQTVELKKTKYYPPETTAAIFWLCNRRPDKWRRGERTEPISNPAETAKAVHDLVLALFETKQGGE